MYKCCLVILKHFVETPKVVGTDNDASTELITIITLLKKKQSNFSTLNHHEHEENGAA